MGTNCFSLVGFSWKKMISFNLQCFLDAANNLVLHDEIERALWLLDNLPAAYRDNKPSEVIALRNEILSKITTISEYCAYEFESQIDPDDLHEMSNTLRGQMLVKEVKALNELNIFPHILDWGPANHWALVVLHRENLKFTYEPLYIANVNSLKLKPYEQYLKRPSENAPKIFLALEIIEHLWNENEIKIQALKHGLPKFIHVSTPRYTFDVECKDWREKEGLGHLRAYTPMEFLRKLEAMFPEYTLEVLNSGILHARLVLT